MNSPALNPIAVVVLAAGASRRLGHPKQLVLFEGSPLVRRAAEAALQVPGASVAVVLGAQEARIRPALDGLPVDLLSNSEWSEGLAASVRLGVVYAEAQGAGAVLFLLVDQPFVTGELLVELVGAYHATGQPLVACEYGGEIGVPMLIDRRYFPELQELSGDRGAKVLLHRYPGHVVRVPFPKGHFDLDTPQDWTNLLS